MAAMRRSSGEVRAQVARLGIGVFAIVAAGSVGFAVGDALATPQKAATIRSGFDSHDWSGSLDDFHWTWKIARGHTLEIKSLNGDVHAERANAGDAVVRAHKHARRSDPAEVKIEVSEHDGDVTICAVYPGGGSGKNACESEAFEHQHTRNSDVVVDFDVRVPAGVRLVARTVNGGVEAVSLDGPVEANSVNGSIEVSTSGEAQAHTVNGSITASLGDLGGDEPLEFESVNGRIRVALPDDADADVHASCLNGSIESEFPIEAHGRMSRHRLEGVIGRGGRSIRLATVNGDITLRRAS